MDWSEDLTTGVVYHPIGVVEGTTHVSVRPELIRSMKSRLVLEPRFEAAVDKLEIGRHLLVVYHLHRVETWRDELLPELFIRRTGNRPNPIGVTLTRIVGRHDSTIEVVGLDAMNGSPILDIKPYMSIWDAPPVTPEESAT